MNINLILLFILLYLQEGLLNHLNTIIYLEDKNFYKKDTFYKKIPIKEENLC